MTYVLTGNNWFGLKLRLNGLISDFIQEHGDLALERLDCSEATLAQINSTLGSASFLADRRMVVATNLSTQKELAGNIEKVLQNVSNTTDLIIVESNIDKRSAYYKRLKKLKDFEEYNRLNLPELIAWVEQRAKEYQATISKHDAEYLVSISNGDQQRIDRELVKLTSYKSEITKLTIDQLVEATPQTTIFQLLDAIFSNNKRRAIQLYDEQRTLGTEPLSMVGMIIWQIHILAIVKSAGDRTDQQVAARSGINPYVIQKTRAVVQKLDNQKIKNLLDRLNSLDISLKSTAIDRNMAVKNFLSAI
jgi:DNA polymerase-3 subunit delta